MLGALGISVAAVCAWVGAGSLLWWGWLPPAWRRGIAVLTSAAGVVFLVFAMRSEGVREATTTMAFLMGSSYVTEQATASASLTYYVLTGVCLVLGTIGLAVGEDTTRSLREHWISVALFLSLVVTALRFCLEKVAAPRFLVAVVGIVWLPPLVGAYFAQNLKAQGKGLRPLVGALVLYALVVRGFVSLLYLAASSLRLGSHYDVTLVRDVWFIGAWHFSFSSGSARQIAYLGVFPQLLFWTSFTLVTGLLGAGVLSMIESLRGNGGHAAALASKKPSFEA
jgi:hypothetical protein